MFLIPGIALVASAWWEPLVVAAATKYLDLSVEQLSDADTTMFVSGWVLIGLGLCLYVYAKSRSGPVAAPVNGISFIEGKAAVKCDTITVNAGVVAVDYFPAMEDASQYADRRHFRIEMDGEFFNDTQRVLRNPVIEFWGVEGLRMTCKNPPFAIFDTQSKEWQPNDSTRTITIPPRSLIRVRFKLGLGMDFKAAQEQIHETYAGTVALVQIDLVNGKQHQFRLCTRSFCGSASVLWPPDKRYPIYNFVKLNIDGARVVAVLSRAIASSLPMSRTTNV